MSSAPEVNTARIGRQKAVSRQTSAPGAPKAKQSLGARIAARAGGGVMRVFLILVALFWLMPTIGLLLSCCAGRRTSRRPAGGRSSPPRRR